MNWKPYGELGNQNGYSDWATVGACGRQNTGIDVRSPQALKYLELTGVQFCTAAPVYKTVKSDVKDEIHHHHHHHHSQDYDSVSAFHKGH